MKKTLVLTFQAIVLALSALAQAGGTDAPLASSDMERKRAAVLGYIAELSEGNASSFKGSISGQNCYQGTEILESGYMKGYKNLVEALHEATGEWVGLISLEYEWLKIFSADELRRANEPLVAYSKAGGLVMINISPMNPWGNDESDIARDPGASRSKTSGTETGIPAGASLDDLIDPSKSVHAAWMRKLDRVAVALQQLRDAGVVVLWRPMQEMNGSWYWWGMKSHPKDPKPYIDVYRHMRDYFTMEKGLNNLIWVYSPNDSMGQDNSSTWNRTVDWAYPGAEYVDIVAGTYYGDGLDIDDYAAYVKMNKPLGMGELGPKTDGPAARKGSWDTHKIIAKIRAKYPRLAFFVCWHSYPKECWSIVSNKDPSALMKDPHTINRDELPAW
jgi:mannan endo-1,4-beta-mannosidase